MQATRIPREDHRLIASVLGCFDDLLSQVRRDRVVPAAALAPYLEFFRDFVEGCHAEIEEAVFASLESVGQETTGTPVAAVLHEHDTWAGQLEALVNVADGEDVDAFLATAEELAAFVRRHAAKEEHCVFPACDLLLQGDDLAALSGRIEKITSEEKHATVRAHCEGLAAAILAENGIAPLRSAPSLPSPARGGAQESSSRSLNWVMF